MRNGREVVRSSDFAADAVQQRRASLLCSRADALRDVVRGQNPVQLAEIERKLWQALVSLRQSLPLRRVTGNRDDVAEVTRALEALDQRIDRFAEALRILAESPEASQLRHTAAME